MDFAIWYLELFPKFHLKLMFKMDADDWPIEFFLLTKAPAMGAMPWQLPGCPASLLSTNPQLTSSSSNSGRSYWSVRSDCFWDMILWDITWTPATATHLAVEEDVKRGVCFATWKFQKYSFLFVVWFDGFVLLLSYVWAAPEVSSKW